MAIKTIAMFSRASNKQTNKQRHKQTKTKQNKTKETTNHIISHSKNLLLLPCLF